MMDTSSAAPSKAVSGTATISASGDSARAVLGIPAGDAHAPGLDLRDHGASSATREITNTGSAAG